MPRATGTQTRTFNYLDPSSQQPTGFLRSATNPENGTVSYTYNGDNTLASKTDAKGQVFTYAYDNYKRMTSISVGGTVLRTYYYDSNPLDSTGYSQYTLGRLAAIQYPSSNAGQINEMYTYTIPGLPSGKRLQVNRTLNWSVNGLQQSVNRSINVDAAYAYDNEGKMTSVTYPTTYSIGAYPYYDQLVPNAGPAYTYGFDSMHRPSTLTDQATSAQVVNNVQYGAANQVLGITYFGVAESRTYNARLQLTSLNGLISQQYTYSPNQNNGKIASSKDLASGEEVSYQYDSLNRLISATTTAASDAVTTPWGQSYGYDGFGNLTNKTVTKGTGPTLNLTVDAATNRFSSGIYDANGNLPPTLGAQFDPENRLILAAGGVSYGYDAGNKRIWKWAGGRDDDGNANNVSIFFWGVDGKWIGTYQFQTAHPSQANPVLLSSQQNVYTYFGGRRVATNGVAFAQDRLGTSVKTYPYGEEKTPNGQDGFKFATYYRETGTNLDYADQRYYTSETGRFLTADPGPTNLAAPLSWNRYPYGSNDPANLIDPDGQLPVCSGGTFVDFDEGEGGAGCTSLPVIVFAPSFIPIGLIGPKPGGGPGEGPHHPSCSLDFQHHGIFGFPQISSAGHGYLHVTTETDDYVVEGYTDDTSLLRAWRDASGIPSDDKKGDSSYGSVSGSFVCDWLPQLDAAKNRVDHDHFHYDGIDGPNSNTALYFFLASLPQTFTPWFQTPNLRGFFAYPF